MRLSCTAYVVDRRVPNDRPRPTQSTLTFFKNPKSGHYSLLLFSAKNKTGQRYIVKDNIQGVLVRFIHEGKTTIQFKEPAHDLFIQADAIQLKSFLSIFRNIVMGKTEHLKINCSADYVPHTAPVKKLVIKQRSDYPTKGFPRTLETLIINDIERSHFDSGILLLTKLKVIDLQNNNIEYLPEAVNKLPYLAELNLRKNCLGMAPLNKWKWLGGGLSKTLINLDMAENWIKILPKQIAKLHSLQYLNLSSNEMRNLPQSIGTLKKLKELIISNNVLTSVPGMLQHRKLDTLDVTGNNFDGLSQRREGDPWIESGNSRIKPKLLSLKEISGQKVLEAQIPYTPENLPRTVIDFLDIADYCLCGRPYFTPLFKMYRIVSLRLVARAYCTTSFNRFAIPFECLFCSDYCKRLFTLGV